MQRQQVLERVREERGSPVEKRRLFDERLAREGRHEPVAGVEDVIDETKGVGLVRFPRIVAEEAGEQPRREQRAERRAAYHAGCATALLSASSSVSASVSLSSSFCAQASRGARLRLRIPSAFW